MTNIFQTPAPGFQAVRHSGDILMVSLQLDSAREGKAFLRTNLGQAHVRRAEIIANVEHGRAILGRDWHDLPMRQADERSFQITLPLCQVGLFEFKTFFVPDDGGELVWPKGENVRVKIEPSATVSGNTIYNAFVRQFGPNRSGQAWTKAHRDAETFLSQAGYTVLPPSGTFADLRRELPVIMDQLGFRIIQLLPIHPAPVTFGRMGRFGSPFAPLDFFTVDASLAVFDRHTTPLEQFSQLVADIHSRDGLVLIDLPADHTGWGSVMQVHHPEWFTRNEDGSFASPGAWGVIWEDLCKLNFEDKTLWMQLAEVFLHWCQLGVDGFRCDAGYMIPAPVWTYITARVREQYPDTIFFLEGLGGAIQTTEDLLQEAGHNWAYSEFFQQFGYQNMLDYTRFAISFSNRVGCLVHFAETHDNQRLAAKSPIWAALRVKTAALFSIAGAFGIANGVEWLATEKIHVHDANSLAWGSEPNLTSLVQTLTRLLNQHPAFQAQATLCIPNSFRGNAIAMLRYPPADDDSQNRPIPLTTPLLVAANPEENQPATLEWDISDFNPGNKTIDLVSNAVIPIRRKGHRAILSLPPAAAYCLSAATPEPAAPEKQLSPRHWQDLRDRVMDFIVEVKGYIDLAGIDIDGLAQTVYVNPRRFARQILPESSYLPIIEWRPGQDEHRVVMVPPQHLILIRHVHPFMATILQGTTCQQRKRSLPQADGSSAILFSPLPAPAETPAEATLVIHVFARQPDGQPQSKNLFHRGALSLLPEVTEPVVNLSLTAEQITPEHVGLCTDQHGGFTLARAAWGLLCSKYDALFAPSLAPLVPVDRTVLLTRVRAWMIYRDYRQELNLNCQTGFVAGYANRLAWSFNVPSGMGQHVILRVEWQLASDRRQASLTFARLQSPDRQYRHTLPDDVPVALYLRPDLDDRPNHQVTKAFQGPEKTFPAAVSALSDGFRFQPSPGHGLTMHISEGTFHESPEWHYQHPLPADAERGLESATDIFCPGYFKCTLLGGSQTTIAVAVPDKDTAPGIPHVTAPTMPEKLPLREALRQSLSAFVVRRDQGKTVLAGFPWFLDWGRDTLICLRGLIAAGMVDDCRDIIQQFASFAEQGTIPNMIRGLDHSNRDTSDAPLWLFVATSDLVSHPKGGEAILDLPCPSPSRPLRKVLNDIADYYWHGAANGIRADHDSALVYSPSHFTWMDTNFPAATPRAGYPVEIQALWIFALEFLAAHGGNPLCAERAKLARRSLEQYFRRPDGRGLADCLHAPTPDTPASKATPDDACRPNQLLAVTLGAVTDLRPVRDIIAATRPLLTPAGIRSLDDALVRHPIPVSSKGRPLNDPYRPYWGTYSGDEDTQRKPAYHNGTSWAWMMPSFCEALVMAYGQTAIPAAKAWIAAAAPQMQRQCLGYLPEIYDGNAPHEAKGCSAQAWSMTEFFRIYQKLAT
ncbi:MAG: Alpha-1,4-glucan:maltose-1-phosphate maltosyltransferase [Lentisphaerae bacterium ADurb.Bin082]|nr:MAG: Alpha-1,4-glucan:maltose-1-phosphate maltosyltransferase [Lentisphaerae bacterium ADurb.Bin082]